MESLRSDKRSRWVALAGLVGVALYSWTAAGLRPFTFGEEVMVAIPAVVVLVAALAPNWMTLPDALKALTRRRALRMLVVVGWIWLGWHLFARGSGAFN